MHRKKYPAPKHPGDIGDVDIAIEKMMVARAVCCACVDVEASLEIDSKLIGKPAREDAKFTAVRSCID